jgi:hypothetical protein
MPLYYFTTILLYYYTTILLYYYTTILLYYYTTILLYYYTTILLHFFASGGRRAQGARAQRGEAVARLRRLDLGVRPVRTILLHHTLHAILLPYTTAQL